MRLWCTNYESPNSGHPAVAGKRAQAYNWKRECVMTRRTRAILSAGIGRAQTQATGSGAISGTVTANRDYALSEASGNHIPALYAVRVRARDTERHITYTVFTQKGHYQIYNLPPGTYQMSALQDGFDSKGPSVELKAGDTKTADVALMVQPDKLRA